MGTLYWNLDRPGKRYVMSGNEAAARGALEAGARVAASYPGSPSVQILECLAAVANERGLYAEWSINEKVALEVAAAASFTGVRALCVMKADGLNVAMDFLTTLPLSGIDGGLVLIVSDDPGAHSSIKEEDTRYLAPPAHVPLLESKDPQETLDMIVHAFAVSEQAGLPVIVRLVTRICHSRGVVELGEIRPNGAAPRFSPDKRFITAGRFHPQVHQRLDKLQAMFDSGPFNRYTGPEKPEVTVFASGVSVHYALESVERLGVQDRVGIAQIGAVWPLSEKFVVDRLRNCQRAMFLEEIEPFLEDQVKILAAQHSAQTGPVQFMGKRSGDVPWVKKARGMGEMDPDIAADALAKALGLTAEAKPSRPQSNDRELPPLEDLPPRLPTFCAGCPHRASYWAIKTALTADGRNGKAIGDIGCYSLGVMPAGYLALSTVHAMGSGLGLASGFGKLGDLGFDQPIISVVGDSTFYHAGIPALINAKNVGSRFLLVILDNDTTAMTGHQPHPGTGKTAMGDAAAPTPITGLLKSLDIPVTVRDPYQLQETTETILDLLKQDGLQTLVLRRECILKARKAQLGSRVYVDQERCLGDSCGCARLCSRVFSCPANVWDEETGKARIDEVVCNGCGVCASLCPAGAIIVETEGSEDAAAL